MKKEKESVIRVHRLPKGTSIGNGTCKTSTMSKHKKRNYKKYKGQG